MKLGVTFSHPHLKYLNLDVNKAFNSLVEFKFETIRLGCYWNEIEKERGKFNFSQIENLLKKSDQRNLEIILTVGMKAPRWPEYYLPLWLKSCFPEKRGGYLSKNPKVKKYTLRFIKRAVSFLKKFSSIKTWQVENEPLDPSGPRQSQIDKEFLKEEIKLVRKLDPQRKILINFWGNKLSKRNLVSKIIDSTDKIGLDVYFKVPTLLGYTGPEDNTKYFKTEIRRWKKAGKEVILTELQAEPWERNEIVTKKPNPPSMNPKILRENLEKVKNWGVSTILFWGFEYWYWQKVRGDDRLWKVVKNLLT